MNYQQPGGTVSQLILRSVGDADDTVELEHDPDLEVGRDDVLVDMEAATLNDTDFRFAAGTYGIKPLLPSVMGTEGVGRVAAVGAAVDPALLGRRVIALPTPTYQPGTWADRAVLPAASVVAVDDRGDAAQLAMLAINPATAQLLLSRYVTLAPGDWIGQNQANSAVGRYVIELARRAGVRTVNVVRREAAARELEDLGAELVLVDSEDLGERVAEGLGDARLRLVLDGVGGATPGALAGSLEFGGTVVSYASWTNQPAAVSAHDLIFRELQVRGFWLINWLRRAPRAEIDDTYGELAELVAQDRLSAPVAATYRLDEYRQAFAAARAPKRSGKVLFELNGANR
jgi:NADPH:quinone reductase-like Zn-dependent oxidoreductase